MRGIASVALLTACLGILAAEAAVAEQLDLATLFAPPAIQDVTVSPNATYLAALGQNRSRRGVLVQIAATGEITVVHRTLLPVTGLAWVDDDTLLFQTVADGKTRTLVIDLEDTEWELKFKTRGIRVKGWLVDPLPAVDDVVLWSLFGSRKTQIFRAPIDELHDPSVEDRYHTVMPSRKFFVAELSTQVIRWVRDREGKVRGAVEWTEDRETVFRYRKTARSWWRSIARWGDGEEEDVPLPVGFAEDNTNLLVISNQGRDTAALMEFDVETGELGRVVYGHPDYDIEGARFRGTALVAVTYMEGGIRKHHYLGEAGANSRSVIEAKFPEREVYITSNSRDDRFVVGLVTATRDPGSYYLIDTQGDAKVLVGAQHPNVDQSLLSEVTAFTVKSKDGLEIESFLAIPNEPMGEPPPLVVMPHGGPIAVRDSLGFDPITQYLASSGFAVLTVNYRGSAGYGKEFLKAGYRAYGRGIEDDIEAAVDDVISRGLVDSERICIFGGSYGGYSALISITRPEHRYRCAASLAGPTDLLLQFETSDFSFYKRLREEFAKQLGDPDSEREQIISVSPAYRAADMNVPIFLAHADGDVRVDIEHAHRMRAMLDAHGKKYEWLLLKNATHSPTLTQWSYLLPQVHRFLRTHLRARPAPVN